MKEIGIGIVIVVALLLGAVTLFALFARTWATFSLKAEKYLIVGAYANKMFILDQTGAQIEREIGLQLRIEASSFDAIPVEKVYFVEPKARKIMLSSDELKFFPNILMLVFAAICLLIGLYLTAVLLGIEGPSFTENITLFSSNTQWTWIKYVTYTFAIFSVALLTTNLFLIISQRNPPSRFSFSLQSRQKIVAGTTLMGEIVDLYTEESHNHNLNKTTLIPKAAIKFSNLYEFPIIMDVIIRKEAKAITHAIKVGDTATIKLNNDRIAIWQ